MRADSLVLECPRNEVQQEILKRWLLKALRLRRLPMDILGIYAGDCHLKEFVKMLDQEVEFSGKNLPILPMLPLPFTL